MSKQDEDVRATPNQPRTPSSRAATAPATEHRTATAVLRAGPSDQAGQPDQADQVDLVGRPQAQREGLPGEQLRRLGRRAHLLRRARALPVGDRAGRAGRRGLGRPADRRHAAGDRRRSRRRRCGRRAGEADPRGRQLAGRVRSGPDLRSAGRALVRLGLHRRVHPGLQHDLRREGGPPVLQAQASPGPDDAGRAGAGDAHRARPGGQRAGGERDRQRDGPRRVAGHRCGRSRNGRPCSPSPAC